VQGILWLAKGSTRGAAETKIIMCRVLSSPYYSIESPVYMACELSEATIWRDHRPELVEFVDPGMLFEEGRYPVHQLLKYMEIDGMKNIRYDNNRWRDAFNIPDHPF